LEGRGTDRPAVSSAIHNAVGTVTGLEALGMWCSDWFAQSCPVDEAHKTHSPHLFDH
jgi:hypothetical protein